MAHIYTSMLIFLGAIVYGFDVRAAAKEQVESAGEE
jgi:NAD/NADP transhydrogenase alpha subunit